MKLLAGFGLVACCLTAFVLVQQAVSAAAPSKVAATDEDAVQQAAQQQLGTWTSRLFKVPKLFDFDKFKQLYSKTYYSSAEQSSRHQFFLARAMRAVVAYVKYRYRQSRFYLAINNLSDLSPKELDLMRNRALAGQQFAFTRKSASGGEAAPNKKSEVEQPAGKLRTRRSAKQKPTRNLSLDMLFGSREEAAKLSPEAQAKVRQQTKSNNPNYVEAEPFSFGLSDQLTDLKLWRLDKPIKSENIFAGQDFEQTMRQLSSSAQDAANDDNDYDDDDEDDDVLFVDHRKSNCFFLPRNQGLCGSCYAFAAVSLLEWLHCVKTGELVPFSEQYIVDCGKRVGLQGCDGGDSYNIGKFVHNFGIELRLHYPYMMREFECPYEEETDLSSTGYLRSALSSGAEIAIELWDEFLKFGPMLVAVTTEGTGFEEYGGGVHDLYDCKQRSADHAMLLVGHGREEGEPYWLIRNSHSVNWGEQGYYKLSKRSNCIYPAGVVLGTEDGARLTFEMQHNTRHDPKGRIKQIYMERVKE